MKDLFTFQNFPLIITWGLVALSYLSFLSVILLG